MLTARIGQSTKKSTKSAYKPSIKPISATEYLMPSESYGGYIVYLVVVRPDGRIVCECSAGEHGRMCKHVRLVRVAHSYRQSPTHLRPAQPPTPSAAPAFRPVPAGMAWS